MPKRTSPTKRKTSRRRDGSSATRCSSPSKRKSLAPGTLVRVSSSSRGKKVELSWKDVSDEANLVILAPTKQGTLKLASVMKGLDTRTKWVQDVDRIEIVRK